MVPGGACPVAKALLCLLYQSISQILTNPGCCGAWLGCYLFAVAEIIVNSCRGQPRHLRHGVRFAATG